MGRLTSLIVLLLTALAPAAHAPPVQITIAQPAEAKTRVPGGAPGAHRGTLSTTSTKTLTRWDISLQRDPELATAWVGK